MSEILIRPYRATDLTALLSVWERALPPDAITRADFIRRVLLDPNFETEGLLVAECGGEVAGFALCLILRQPIENVGLMEHRGFITAFGVAPQHQRKGAGAALLNAAEEFFRTRGRSEITIAPYAPNYFVPGVDREAYAGGLAWLQARGFTEFSEGIAMDALIGRFDLDERLREREAELLQKGIRVRPLQLEESAAFLEWMAGVMPGDWVTDARGLLQRVAKGDAPAHSVFVAEQNGQFVGYCKFAGEHFGPFGVQDSHQGSGIGTLLLAKTLRQMRLEGHHAAFVLWTGERAAKGVYARLGFTVSRRFALLKKPLS